MRSTICVIAIHILVVAAFFYASPPLSSKPPIHHVAVHYHEIQPMIPKGLEKEPFFETSAPKQENKPLPLPIPKKNPPPPKPATPKAVRPEKKVQANKGNEREKLIAMMQDSLKTLEGTSTRKNLPAVKSTPAFGSLASESISFSSNYEQVLIATLESTLELPEKGEVKIKLTVNRQGKVERVQVDKANTLRNRTYIEETLPILSFSPFGSEYKGEKTHTFSVTFTSDR